MYFECSAYLYLDILMKSFCSFDCWPEYFCWVNPLECSWMCHLLGWSFKPCSLWSSDSSGKGFIREALHSSWKSPPNRSTFLQCSFESSGILAFLSFLRFSLGWSTRKEWTAGQTLPFIFYWFMIQVLYFLSKLIASFIVGFFDSLNYIFAISIFLFNLLTQWLYPSRL